ncbi:MAG: ABC transporter substrate-binding protein [Methanothrix sp.]|nr:ABC transporter substrate-binding protein [Methanothrix sp.]
MKKISLTFFVLFVAAFFSPPVHSHADDRKVYVGLNAEASHPTSTSDDAIKQGMLIAIDEINRAGGVLGGRKLALVEKDNRSVPARAVQNNREFAAMPDLVAVFGGKFSSAIIESLPLLHELKLPMMTPWSANDRVVNNGYNPNYAFRLSITDTWAVETMMSYAGKKDYSKVGLMLGNNSWGRSNHEAIKKFVAAHPKIQITSVQWYNYGEKSLVEKYDSILKSGAKAVILIAIETESSLLVKEVAQLPAKQRLPIISHASITGGDFPKMAGDSLARVNLVFPQTCIIQESGSDRLKPVMAEAQRLFGLKDPADIKSPMGFAHAYDLMHILALAINKAGSTDRTAVHNALEEVTDYDGLVMHYKHPFTRTRHDALSIRNVILVRYDASGVMRKIK